MNQIYPLTRNLCFLLLTLVASVASAQDLQLPAPRQSGGMPLREALAKRSTAREFDPKALPVQQLSDLLWAAFGINRPDGKRTAPSAKNSQETDIYVVLKDGAYLYAANSNQLSLVEPEDLRSLAATQAFATNAPVTLLFVADLSRMEKGVNDENLAMANIDTGYISQNVYLFSASEGLVTGARASFDRKRLESKLKLRATQRILLAQSVGCPKP